MSEKERVYRRQQIFHLYNPSLQATVAKRPDWCYCNDKLLTLKRFREQLGAEAVNAWLCLQLNHTAKSWGSADGLTSDQLQAAAAAIAVAYGELNLGEVMLYLGLMVKCTPERGHNALFFIPLEVFIML